jgi:hypothetical protein
MTALSSFPSPPRPTQTPLRLVETDRETRAVAGQHPPIVRIMLAPVLWLAGILGAAAITTAFLIACAASAVVNAASRPALR